MVVVVMVVVLVVVVVLLLLRAGALTYRIQRNLHRREDLVSRPDNAVVDEAKIERHRLLR